MRGWKNCNHHISLWHHNVKWLHYKAIWQSSKTWPASCTFLSIDPREVKICVCTKNLVCGFSKHRGVKSNRNPHQLSTKQNLSIALNIFQWYKKNVKTIQAMTWVNYDILFYKWIHSEKAKCYIIPFSLNVQKRQEDLGKELNTSALEWAWEKLWVTVPWCRIRVWGIKLI